MAEFRTRHEKTTDTRACYRSNRSNAAVPRTTLHASLRPPVGPQRALARSKAKSETNRPFDIQHSVMVLGSANATTYEGDERQGNERAGMIQNPPPQNYFG